MQHSAIMTLLPLPICQANAMLVGIFAFLIFVQITRSGMNGGSQKDKTYPLPTRGTCEYDLIWQKKKRSS